MDRASAGTGDLREAAATRLRETQSYDILCESTSAKECDVASLDTFGAKSQLGVGDASYEIFRIDTVDGHDRLPYSLKILLENLLRTEDGANITADHIRALGGWDADRRARAWRSSSPRPGC